MLSWLNSKRMSPYLSPPIIDPFFTPVWQGLLSSLSLCQFYKSPPKGSFKTSTVGRLKGVIIVEILFLAVSTILWSTAKKPNAAESFSRSYQRADVRYTCAPTLRPMVQGHRLRGGTPWRYDGKASCMSKQTDKTDERCLKTRFLSNGPGKKNLRTVMVI